MGDSNACEYCGGIGEHQRVCPRQDLLSHHPAGPIDWARVALDAIEGVPALHAYAERARELATIDAELQTLQEKETHGGGLSGVEVRRRVSLRATREDADQQRASLLGVVAQERLDLLAEAFRVYRAYVERGLGHEVTRLVDAINEPPAVERRQNDPATLTPEEQQALAQTETLAGVAERRAQE